MCPNRGFQNTGPILEVTMRRSMPPDIWRLPNYSESEAVMSVAQILDSLGHNYVEEICPFHSESRCHALSLHNEKHCSETQRKVSLAAPNSRCARQNIPILSSYAILSLQTCILKANLRDVCTVNLTAAVWPVMKSWIPSQILPG